jgi:hypothetical protein
MKTKLVFLALGVVISGGLILSSCKKDNSKQNNYQGAKDNSLAEGVFNRSYNQISNASHKATGGKEIMDSVISGCPTLTISGSGWPKTVTLDFGSGCHCDDSIIRSGSIVSVITGPYIQSGTVVTSTFNNYHEIINGVNYQATGTQIITNQGPNGDGHPVYAVDVQGSIISQYGTISYTSQRTNEWFAGYNSWFNPFDDQYRITGSASGTDINGDPFSITITVPLEFSIMCDITHFWVITKGKFDLSYPGTNYPDITVDYGNGECDYTIYVTINGHVYTINYV